MGSLEIKSLKSSQSLDDVEILNPLFKEEKNILLLPVNVESTYNT